MAENEGIKEDGSLSEDEDDDLYDGDSHLNDRFRDETDFQSIVPDSDKNSPNVSVAGSSGTDEGDFPTKDENDYFD